MEIKSNGVFQHLNKNEIQIDRAYQRNQETDRKKLLIGKIIKEFDWRKFGCITVTISNDGSKYCIDGGGRLTAAMQIENIIYIPCIVFHGVSQQEQADIFTSSAVDRINMSQLDKYRAGIVALNPIYLRMKTIIETSGRSISKHLGPSLVSCLEPIYANCKDEYLYETFSRLWLSILIVCDGYGIDSKFVKGLVALNKK
ncbi:MAG: hypothetical protein WC373_12820, partial [Smithella sp.]